MEDYMDDDSDWAPGFLNNLPLADDTTGVWTPECIDETDLLNLTEAESGSPKVGQLLGHLEDCAYCRNAYLVFATSMRVAKRAREIQDLHSRVLSTASFGTDKHCQSFPRVHLNWAGLSASSSDTTDIEGIFCEGALRVTVWLDGDQALLTAVNDPKVMWHMDESNTPLQVSGGGLLLAGQVIRYDIDTSEGELTGYIVLPKSGGVSVAETNLGSYSRLAHGSLSCEVVAGNQLTEPEAILDSVRRTTRLTSRGAWGEYLLQQGDNLTPDVQDAIRKGLASA
jgi:hypothetical protein